MLFQHPTIAEASAEVQAAEVLSFDVFDTILVRNPVGERERLWQAARKVEQRTLGKVDAATFFSVRRQAQRLGYRAIDVGGGNGDLRLEDVLRRIALLLGQPASFASLCREAEMEVEHISVRANEALAHDMRVLKAAGKRIIAVSDTAWSRRDVAELVRAKLGSDVVDRFYSSADEGVTKRAGGLFRRVLAEEGRPASAFVHLGDDRHADVEQARRAGISALHAARGRSGVIARRGRYVPFALWKLQAEWRGSRPRPERRFASREEVGEELLGPIAAEVCGRLWLYLSYHSSGSVAALFCARGGLAIEAMLARFLERTGLPLDVPRGKFMVSRIAALRLAFLRDAVSARMEMAREFQGRSCGHAAHALSGLPCDDAAGWAEPFDYGRLRSLLAGTEQGRRAMSEIVLQADRLERHLRAAAGGAGRVVLCDTGLYGSTGRFLKEGLPDLAVEAVLVARCDYKHLGREHFGYTTGLVTESNGYAPWDVRSSILRYWHLMEELCELDLPSVRNHQEDGNGGIRSNLEVSGWEERLAPPPGSMLAGVMRYLDRLEPDNLARLASDAERAWWTLRNAIAVPRQEHIEIFTARDRSVDFGDDATVPVIPSPGGVPGWGARMRSVRSSLWREGAITRNFPHLRFVLLPTIAGIHSLRALQRRTFELRASSRTVETLRSLAEGAARPMDPRPGGSLSGKRV